jgi:hypothetical protein
MEATSVCSLVRGGEAASQAAQEKAFIKNNMVLGVLPGDEYCLVTLSCGYVANIDDMKKSCERAGGVGNSALNHWACVTTTQRGPKDAYTYQVVHPATTCALKVQGGPSVTDEELVQKCTRAAMDSLTPEGIKNFQ